MVIREIFDEVSKNLAEKTIKIDSIVMDKPWGGFFVITESSANEFISTYYPEYSVEDFGTERISPKILIVLPGKRLSWQYHFRRSELWKLIEGTALVSRSENDEEKKPEDLIVNKIVELDKGERHRLIGGEEYGIVAEIWRHTDSNNPSNEEDIVRIQDDFGR